MRTPIVYYWLQEGGRIARAWIADPKVYPGIPLMVFVPDGTGGRFVKNVGDFIDNTCQAFAG